MGDALDSVSASSKTSGKSSSSEIYELAVSKELLLLNEARRGHDGYAHELEGEIGRAEEELDGISMADVGE